MNKEAWRDILEATNNEEDFRSQHINYFHLSESNKTCSFDCLNNFDQHRDIIYEEEQEILDQMVKEMEAGEKNYHKIVNSYYKAKEANTSMYFKVYNNDPNWQTFLNQTDAPHKLASSAQITNPYTWWNKRNNKEK